MHARTLTVASSNLSRAYDDDVLMFPMPLSSQEIDAIAAEMARNVSAPIHSAVSRCLCMTMPHINADAVSF